MPKENLNYVSLAVCGRIGQWCAARIIRDLTCAWLGSQVAHDVGEASCNGSVQRSFALRIGDEDTRPPIAQSHDHDQPLCLLIWTAECLPVSDGHDCWASREEVVANGITWNSALTCPFYNLQIHTKIGFFITFVP